MVDETGILKIQCNDFSYDCLKVYCDLLHQIERDNVSLKHVLELTRFLVIAGNSGKFLYLLTLVFLSWVFDLIYHLPKNRIKIF